MTPTQRSLDVSQPSGPSTVATSSFSTPVVPNTISRRSIVKKVLATVKVIRADVADNGKPSNVLLHNLAAHVNLYTEEEATVGHITHKVREEMGNDNLILVGTNGLTIYDQEGTRGICHF